MQSQTAHSKAVPSLTTILASLHPCGFIPAKTPLARALMPRQPYSEAVQSDVSVPYKGNRRGRKDYCKERLHPSPFCKGRGLGSGLRIPSSQEGNRGVENAFLNGKEGRVGFRKKLLRKRESWESKNYRFSTHFLPLFVKADHKYRQHAMIPTPPKTMYIPSIIISFLICYQQTVLRKL